MKVRCWLKDNLQRVGFADVFRTHDDNGYDDMIKNYIFLWTFDNLDEDNHQLVGDANSKYDQTFIKVYIAEIEKIEAIFYSNPRWRAKLTNLFQFD
ncbi:hypothetical protein [Candidatus Stoquefichus sp. SB1]|uniref:hypothetical protein n=1 Tax=Candidatus Stoquefichus sp. SB1 TaxID=1658109 RepID=UPI00067E982C|nr:hypothetical protein [Candidatus Stoquefichus sp. SB1]